MSKKTVAILITVPVALFLVSLFLGRYFISPLTAIQILISHIIPMDHHWSGTMETVIMQIRLPRALLAMLIGAGLSISGASFQGMFRNPLVSPDILGVSSAAGFGAALGILLFSNNAAVEVSAMVFGIAGVILTYLISRVYKTTPILMLVLSGIIVGALFSSLISLIKYVADPYSKLPAITYWLMGSLATATMNQVILAGIPILLGSIGLVLISWRINLLSMGDDEARAMGVNTETLKVVIITCGTLITAAAVTVSGIIGWVGLVIPHISRMICGPDHRKLLPVSLAVGATFMLVIDNIARTVSAAEIPLGILTAIIGAPFFAYLIRKTKGGWA